MTLQEMMEHLFKLYGRRNRIFLSGLRERIDFLNLAIGDLQEAVRKKHGPYIYGIALARVVARIFCVVESFQSLPLVETIARKYPSGYCSYCKKSPCACPEKRPSATLEKAPTEEQLQWSLRQWCEHLGALYGARNKRRGIENILNRLFKEIAELLSLQMTIPNMAGSLNGIEEEFALELADALAWTIAVANLLGIDLESAVLQRFGKGCWKCRQVPCVCVGFNVQPANWENVLHAHQQTVLPFASP